METNWEKEEEEEGKKKKKERKKKRKNREKQDLRKANAEIVIIRDKSGFTKNNRI